MSEDQHDQPAIPDDAVEDLAPDEEGQEASGGAIYMKYSADLDSNASPQIKGENLGG
jgi:hypothetical protein